MIGKLIDSVDQLHLQYQEKVNVCDQYHKDIQCYRSHSNYSNVLISGTAYLIILFLPTSLNVVFPGHSN